MHVALHYFMFESFLYQQSNSTESFVQAHTQTVCVCVFLSMYEYCAWFGMYGKQMIVQLPNCHCRNVCDFRRIIIIIGLSSFFFLYLKNHKQVEKQQQQRMKFIGK